MKANITLLLSIFFGGIMSNSTFGSLGELGNKIMNLTGTILIVYAFVVLLKRAYQSSKKKNTL